MPVDYSHTINIPSSATYKLGINPRIQDMARDTNRPESEISALYTAARNDVHRKELNDPSKQVIDDMGNVSTDHQVWKDTAQKVYHPEEETADEEEIMAPEDEGFFGADDFVADDAQESTIDDPFSMGFGEDDMNLVNDTADMAASDYTDDLGEDMTDFSTDTFNTEADAATTPGEVNATETAPETDAVTEESTDET